MPGAGLPVAFGTSHVALLHRAKLRKGQTALILGAAGGVGTAAVQVGCSATSEKRFDGPPQLGMTASPHQLRRAWIQGVSCACHARHPWP